MSKDFFKNHIDQLKILFCRLREAGLKVNYPKFSFGLKEVPYLGYSIIREDIKPDQKKVQGMMYLGRSTTTTEARALIVMIRYYRYM